MFLLLMEKIINLADLFFSKNVPLIILIETIIYLLPSIFFMTIPLASLLATLIAFSRLSADSELISMKAIGASNKALIKPLIFVGIATALVNLSMGLYFVEKGSTLAYNNLNKIVEHISIKDLKANEMYNKIPGIMLYVNKKISDTEFEDMIMIQTVNKSIINAKKALLHDFDKNYFEGCLPIEVLASRGVDTLRFGPLKPVGLENNNHQYYAVVQLRQDDLIGDFYNLVGFQTNLTYGEQKRVFSLIPGLENAKFARFGLMHRNSYIYAPKILNDDLSMKVNKNIFIAGQLSGVEGYVESAASGLLAAIYLYLRIKNKPFKALSFNTVLGALVRYITHTGINNFQPMNANFGIIYRANKEDKTKVINTSLKAIDEFIKYIND